MLQRGRGAGDLAAKPSQSEAAVAPAERATRGLARRVDSRGWRGGDYSLWSCQWVVQASRRRCTVAKARRVGSCAEEHQSRSWRRHALLATRLFALLSKWLKTSSRSLPRLASKFERHSISGGVASALAPRSLQSIPVYMHGPDEPCFLNLGRDRPLRPLGRFASCPPALAPPAATALPSLHAAADGAAICLQDRSFAGDPLPSGRRVRLTITPPHLDFDSVPGSPHSRHAQPDAQPCTTVLSRFGTDARTSRCSSFLGQTLSLCKLFSSRQRIPLLLLSISPLSRPGFPQKKLKH